MLHCIVYIHLSIFEIRPVFLFRTLTDCALQVQDKFRLDLSDEEAVHYMQSLIDESVHALFAAVVEQIHKFAQVRVPREACFSRFSAYCPESSWSHTPHASSCLFWDVLGGSSLFGYLTDNLM